MDAHQWNGVEDYSDGRTSSDNSGKGRQHQHWERYQSCDPLQQQHRPQESYQSPNHLQQKPAPAPAPAPAPVTVSPPGYAANNDSSLSNKVVDHSREVHPSGYQSSNHCKSLVAAS
ncbi:hypothetical protein V6N13_096951 [Hibiscus sabdariffa]|uniref:Uncharacterized protein n=2 Tax=Hibiscus sabdariffa TaxID=183260 RepID=A0ABR2ASK8_9ROSI